MGKGSLLFHKGVIGEQSGVLCLLCSNVSTKVEMNGEGHIDNEEASNVCVWGP